MKGVSFVVTLYNKEQYLEATLKSILAQKGDFEREYIVVDDQSTDRSLEIAQDLIGVLPNGKVISQINTGPAGAQNKGVSISSMPVLKFIDADDLYPPDCIERLLPGLDLPGVALVHGDGKVLESFNDQTSVDRMGEPPSFKVLDKPLFNAIRYSLSGASGILVDKEAYLASGGCDERVFNHENSMIFRIGINNSFAFTKDIVLFGPPREFRTKHGGHLGDDMLQMEHDRNAALYGLIRDFSNLPLSIKRLALKRAAGRSWNWSRRINKKKIFCDKVFWIRLISYLPWLPNYENLLFRTLAPYRISKKIKLSPAALNAELYLK
jgi:glycosyltransferase involved in cell wall biosynthesis